MTARPPAPRTRTTPGRAHPVHRRVRVLRRLGRRRDRRDPRRPRPARRRRRRHHAGGHAPARPCGPQRRSLRGRRDQPDRRLRPPRRPIRALELDITLGDAGRADYDHALDAYTGANDLQRKGDEAGANRALDEGLAAIASARERIAGRRRLEPACRNLKVPGTFRLVGMEKIRGGDVRAAGVPDGPAMGVALSSIPRAVKQLGREGALARLAEVAATPERFEDEVHFGRSRSGSWPTSVRRTASSWSATRPRRSPTSAATPTPARSIRCRTRCGCRSRCAAR